MSVVVHVGFPKTATTWLQTRVFNRHPAIDYWRDVPGFDWVTDVVNLHDFDFDAAAMGRRLSAARQAAPGRVAVISLEGLVGDVFAGGWDTLRNADRLKAVLGRARIVITIRSQAPMIGSLYNQYIVEGGVGGFEAFLRLAAPSRVRFSLNALRYDRIAGYYRTLFGDDAVHVCLYEKLVETPRAFLDDLAAFIGVAQFVIDDNAAGKAENPGLSAASLRMARLGNRFLHSGLNPMALLPPKPVNAAQMVRMLKRADAALLRRLFPAASPIGAEARARIEDHYREPNRLLADAFGLPLAKYGYPL